MSNYPMLHGNKLNDELVLKYLIDNPDFFIRNAESMENIRIPHVVKDAISLVEWKLSQQQSMIQRLEEDLSSFIVQVRDNEVLFERLLLLQNQLIMSSSLVQLIDTLANWAQQLGLVGVDIRLFDDYKLIGPSRYSQSLFLAKEKFESFRICRMGNKAHYLGSLNNSELSLLLPNKEKIGSVAILLLGENHDIGMLIFSSQDKYHYHAEMGTLFLSYLGKFLPPLLMRWITR